jgi:endo-1,4-beta-D-glucanase Y
MSPDQSAANTELQNSYNDWKARYLTSNGAGGHLRVQRPQDGYDTVSEGIGYGMILAAYIGDRPTFDGLWNYAKLHFNANSLMHWRIGADGAVLNPNSATDADEDIALALIVADKKWGGYTNDATTLISNILSHDVESTANVLKPGDSWGGANDPHPITNPSYFSPGYYKVFQAYTGNARWGLVVDKTYQIIASINARSGAGTTGLLPNWANPSGDPVDMNYYGGFQNSYDYTYDASRVPWRLAIDAAWYCENRAISQLSKINNFFAGVGAPNIRDGYRLDGTLIGHWHNSAFVAPAAAGAIVSNNSAYKTSMWNETVNLRDGQYYQDSLRLLSLLFMSGNMNNPINTTSSPHRVLDDFESGNTAKWSTFGDGSTSVNLSLVSPGKVGNYAMKLQYGIISWGGVSQGFQASQDWSGYQSFDFWFSGNSSGNTIRLEISDNKIAGSGTDTSERFEYRFIDNGSGWRRFSIPWESFQRRADWQPTGAPDDGLTLTQVWGFNFAPILGAGSFHLDQLELATKTYSLLDDFESGNTSRWTTFKDTLTTVAPSVIQPSKIGNYAMKIQYNIVAWGGISQGFQTPQDWSSYQFFEFWVYGNNTGNTIRLEISDNRPADSGTDTSERFEYKISDNYSGWRYYSIPWSSFTRRADWQPTGAPNDGFNLIQIWGFNFAPISGSGTFQLDQVQLAK